MSGNITLHVRFTNQGSFVPGESVDHVIAQLAGPSNPPAQYLGANVQYITFGPNLLPGNYTYTLTAYDASFVVLSTATGTVSIQNPPINALLPQRFTIQASPNPGYFAGYIEYKNGGSFSSTQVLSTITCTLSGTQNQVVTIPAGASKVTFGPGMTAGQYSYSLQAYDQNAVAMGPASNGMFWYAPAVNEPLLMPQSALSVFVNAESYPVPGDHIAIPGLAIPGYAWPSELT